MKFIILLFIVSLAATNAAIIDEHLKVKLYILPNNIQTFEEVLNCESYHYSNVSSCYNCSMMTLNELIQVNQGHMTMDDKCFYEIVFISGTHIVNVSHNQLLFKPTNYTLRMNLLGDGDVTILCMSEFYFKFLLIQEIAISNIRFKNCAGNHGHNFHQTLNLSTGHLSSMIVLNRIQIINQKKTGIAIRFSNKAQNHSFSLTNSYVRTESAGLFIAVSNTSYMIAIRNVLFHGSCIVLDEAQGKHKVIINNSSFIRCLCSPVLSIHGHAVVKLNDITINDTKSPILIHSIEKSSIYLQGTCFFCRNKGAVLITSHSRLIFSSAKVVFVKNKVVEAVLAVDNSMIIFDNSHVTLANNDGKNSGGITAANQANILFNNSRVYFKGNSGTQGGAMSLYTRSVLTKGSSLSVSTVKFVHNKARNVGGAIFIDDGSYISAGKLQKSAIQTKSNVHFKFSNNVALKGGDNIYGGWVYWSVNQKRYGWWGWHVDYTVKFNSNISKVLHFDDGAPGITSDPTRVCVCLNGIPNCNITYWEITGVYPGQTVKIDLVAVGQSFGTVEADVKADLVHQLNSGSHNGRIIEAQEIQMVKKTCTTLNYAILTNNKEERLRMTIWSSIGNTKSIFGSQTFNMYQYTLGFQFKQLSIGLKLKDCPLAFSLDEVEQNCVCLKRLKSLGFCCNSVSYEICRNRQQWIGRVYEHISVNESLGMIAHQYCPFDYCRNDYESLLIRLEYPDEQCAFNHSGILCGGCQTNFSRVLGSSKCKKCSNIMLLAILPSITLAGLLLVIFLMVLNLTVSVGTINGLIFYANVIQIQHATFFTPESSNSFLSVFIAWLNLDFGIESCFFDGFDAYAEMWLQLCFLLYIWLIAIIIIVSSHYSTRGSNKNLIQVLATLFLLSYTKLLRLAIDVFSLTTITYPDGYVKAVWLYDGNVDFLKGKHIPLFVATLSLLVFLAPYTLSLVSIQWLLRVKIRQRKIRQWFKHLKSFFNAYIEPYKANHCYWTGLLLLARLIMIVMVVFFFKNKLTYNMLSIMILSSVLLVWLYFTRWVYKDLINNCLEMIFLGNLGLTFTIRFFLFYSHYNTRYSTIVTYTSIGITFTILLGIVVYHVHTMLLTKSRALPYFRRIFKKVEDKKNSESKADLSNKVTHTVVDLRQPLLEF